MAYETIGLPPSEGAVHDTTAAAFPATAPGATGAPGTVTGTTAAVGGEDNPNPTALEAATVKVYAVPLTNPTTVSVVAADTKTCASCATPPIHGVMAYDTIGLPPSEGAV